MFLPFLIFVIANCQIFEDGPTSGSGIGDKVSEVLHINSFTTWELVGLGSFIVVCLFILIVMRRLYRKL